MSARDYWSSSEDPEINVQPETENPHNTSPSNLDQIDVSGYIPDGSTHEFSSREISMEELYSAAADLSETLTRRFLDDGEYVMAEIGSEGIRTVAHGDENDFWVDEVYDPEVVEGDLSPLKIMDETGYAEKLGFSVRDYSVGHIDSEDHGLEEEWPISFEDLELNNQSIIVAPGLQQTYRQKL